MIPFFFFFLLFFLLKKPSRGSLQDNKEANPRRIIGPLCIGIKFGTIKINPTNKQTNKQKNLGNLKINK